MISHITNSLVMSKVFIYCMLWRLVFLQETQLSLTNRATHLCNVQWRGSPENKSLPICVTTPNLVALCQTVYA